MRIIKIGRNAGNDMVISEPAVSSQHAVITVSDQGIVEIKDLNSKNGTFVNGKRVQSAVRLTKGDTVLLGQTRIDWEKALAQPGKTAVTPKADPVILPADIKDRRSIGRAPDSQIRLNHDDVSGNHALLSQRRNGEVWLTDRNSTNGTYVNGRRITSQALKKGDTVLISGKYPLLWETIFPALHAGQSSNRSRRIWLVACASVFFLLLCGGIAYYWMHRPMPPEKIYAKYRKSVVMIYQTSAYAAYIPDKSGEKVELGEYIGDKFWSYFWMDGKGDIQSGIAPSQGTGFFISTDGKIMTNRHVVALTEEEKGNAEKIKEAVQVALLKKYPGNEQALLLARSVKVEHRVFFTGVALNDTHVQSTNDFIPCSIYKVSPDEKTDIAILQLNSKKTPAEVTNPVDLNDIATGRELDLGKKVYTIGFPQSFVLGGTEIGLEANNQSGEITQERGEYQYGHNITIHQGASGSPVFNDRGKFAGVIVSGYLGLSQGYNQAVKPDRAAALAN